MLATAPLTKAEELLRRLFGFPAFRGMQARVIERVLAGDNTLAVMPTGAGKSLTYQLPAVMLPGTTIVVSPLIALMHDQLRAAEAVGIRAATLTSADSNRAETIQRLLGGELDLLYVAPERASQSGFRDLLRQVRVALFAIDEAHCVSEWGHDFRPDYRLLRPLLDSFADTPRLALTATADAHTRADILTQLGIPDSGLIVAGFDRPNIRYAIHPRASLKTQVVECVSAIAGAGIVYAQTRDATEVIAAAIAASGRPARIYHAGLPPETRAAHQSAFVASEDMVMVATVAFGMGIDKPDVRFVVHAGLPKSIEAYYQETGRAGRDGDPAQAHLFWGAADFSKARARLSEVPEDRRAGDRTRLNALAALVEAPTCRRAILLRHFGEDPPVACGNCDNCLSAPDQADASELAQKLLSAVYRTGQSFGLGHVVKVLTGDADARVTARAHDRLSVFGIVGDSEAAMLRPLARTLLATGALEETEHGGLMLGTGARAILKGEQSVALVMAPKREPRRRGERGERGAGPSANPVGDPLFEALRAKRRELAADANIPPYVIFHDSVLRDMAGLKPRTLSAMGELPGVGARKLEAWGEAFLGVIRHF
jgi:ATP-dependent DNA helicase RecQ